MFGLKVKQLFENYSYALTIDLLWTVHEKQFGWYTSSYGERIQKHEPYIVKINFFTYEISVTTATAEPQYNELPRDRENVFVISRNSTSLNGGS